MGADSNTILTPDQRNAFDSLMAWMESGPSDPFYLAGLAGTGKTTVISEWSKCHTNIAYAAYTGKAAHVMRQKGITEASTIHRLMYDCFPDGKDGKGRQLFRFQRKFSLPYDLIIIDEASMVPETLRSDLESYGIPVCYVGDHGQLPPVGNGATSNRMEDADYTLTTIQRQAAGNPIITWAHRIRQGELPPFGTHGDTLHRVKPSRLDDVLWVTLEHDGKVLCGKNDTRHRLNQVLRRLKFPDLQDSKALFSFDVPLTTGDIVVGLRNNLQSGIFNGMLGRVLSIDADDNVVGESSITLQIAGSSEPATAIICNSAITRGCRCPDHDHLDYGYCLTVHKAQGSEWDAVVLVNERMGMDRETYYRWLYTGVTRAAKELVIVG